MRAWLSHPKLYAAWQAPFVRQKVSRFLAHNDLNAIRSVLDVGCGPGTNAPMFVGKAYRGVDIDPDYVAEASARFGSQFETGDAANLRLTDLGPVDCVFVNSLIHHLDDDAARRLLARTDLLTADGRLHVIDLYLPSRGIPHWLARADRGDHPRPLARLRALIEEQWSVEVMEPFGLRLGRVTLWAMVYFRARPRN